MEISQDNIRLGKIFHPYAFEKQSSVASAGQRFVHYTSADAAMNIMKNKEIWMRNSSCMDDYMEIDHGMECVENIYRSETGEKFKKLLEEMFPGICSEIEELFDGWMPYFQTDTYITCLSEHDDDEDRVGRLSMWRAYGKQSGVALVVNNPPFLSPSDALKAYTSPVAYLDNQEFEAEFGKVVKGIEDGFDFLRIQGRNAMKSWVFQMFRFAVLCTKHPGFHEEREWRIVHTPSYDKSERLIKEIRSINNSPQPIYKIPLKNVPEENFVGAEIPELIDRIIIGPTQFPSATHKAFVSLLVDAGVPNPESRVFVSDIPLR